MKTNRQALLLVVSAPSGAGKSSLCSRLMERFPGMAYSVSCTTRPPRGREQNGVHYHFLSEAQFAARIAEGGFLEHAVVHGNRYGTLRSTVEATLAQGRDLIMDIDVQGAAQIRAACAKMAENDPVRRGFVDLFIAPPSMDELRRRLCGRGTDSAETIERRLRNAQEEMRQQPLYRYTVINDDFETAVDELARIVEQEHARRV